MWRRSLLLFVVACATPRPQRAGCTQVEGMYTFDPKLCRVSHAALPVNVMYEMFPDGGMLPDEPTLIGIHQDGCSGVSMAMHRRGFALDGVWKDGALISDNTHPSNLPGPIAIGSS